MQPAKHYVMGLGVCCLDFICRVPEEFLLQEGIVAKGGSCHIEQAVFDRLLARCPATPAIIPGGSAANTIRTLAQLGESCQFFGQIGNDDYGKKFLESLNTYHVDPVITVIPNYTTPRILCLITPDGQRTMREPYAKYPSITLHPADFLQVKWLHIEARRIESCNYTEIAMQIVKQNGAKISLDLSSYDLVLRHKDRLISWIKTYVDVVFANQDEIAVLSEGQTGLVLQSWCSLWVVTLGAEGCLVNHHGEQTCVAGFSAQVVDTTGAGDAFAGGFLHGLLRGNSLVDCATLGNRLGAACVEVVGPLS